MSIRTCLSPTICVSDVPIFIKTILPKPKCEWGMPTRPDFDIASWKKMMGFSLDHQLTGLSSDILLNDMNISEYLEKESCQRTKGTFSSAINDWNSECHGNITLPSLSGPVTCHIPDYCTGISCCVDVSSIGRSFHAYAEIDICDHRLTVGIEQLHINISLIDYVWGQKQSLSLKGLVLLEYQLYDLRSEEQFLMFSTIKICTSNASCDLTLLVLNNTRIPKENCGKPSNEVFDMDAWLMGRNISSPAVLSNADRLLVLEDMGLASFLNSEQCFQHRQANLGGWSQDCKLNLSLPELPAGVKCHVLDFCTGISCCLPIETLNRPVEIHLVVDSCNNVLSIGIEKLTRTVSLVTKSLFRRTERFLNGLIRTELLIDNLEYEKVVLLNVNVSACLNTNHRKCIDLVQLRNIYLPEVACDTKMEYVTPGFSLNEWLKENDFAKMPTLPDYASSVLLEDLKISQFLQSHVCDRNTAPYGKSASGMTNDCPANMSLPGLGKELSCFIPGKCTAVDCCMDVGLIGRPVHIVVDINPCQYQMTLEIEDYKRIVSLLDYDWGTIIHMWLGGVIRLDLSLYNMVRLDKYLVTLNASVCWNAKEPCEMVTSVYDNSYLRNIPCSRHTGFKDSNFSFANWTATAGVLSGNLTNHDLNNLFEETGVVDFLAESKCDINPSSLSQGWKNECPRKVELQSLNDHIRCKVMDYCTGINCCVYIPQINYSFNTYLFIDTCDLKLSIGVERLKYDISLNDYQWGEADRIWFFGLTRMDFTLHDLVGERKYLVSLNISTCLEAREPCSMQEVLLKDVKLPKTNCEWGLTDQKLYFSLNEWINSRGLAYLPESPLSISVSSALLEYLGIAPYLRDYPCQRMVAPYHPSAEGWRRECALNTALLPISGPLSCVIPKTCSAVECCLDVDLIGRSFNSHIQLDPCNFLLTVGIENFSFNVSLLDYEWGAEEKLWLGRLIRLDFRIFDLTTEDKYLMTMKINFCYERDICNISYTVLQNTKLSKLPCFKNSTFAIKDFSLSQWFGDHHLVYGSNMSTMDSARLLQDMKLPEFLLDQPCSNVQSPFRSVDHGWSKECAANFTLNTLPDQVKCRVPNYCTGVECCTNVNALHRSFHTFLSIDPCSYTMHVGIERLEYNISLVDYDWGKLESIYLQGIIHLDYNLEDNPGKMEYLVNMNLSVCLEAKSACYLDTVIFDMAHLPKRICTWDQGYVIQDFSLIEWLVERDFPTAKQLRPDIVDRLFNTLGVAPYIQSQQCSRKSVPYIANGKGWNSECPKNISLPDLVGPVSCHIPSYCTGIECCVDVDLVLRSFHTFIFIDTCNYRMTVGIENLAFNVSLFGYEWGKKEKFYMKNVIRMDFKIEDLHYEHQFLLNLNISVCFETRSHCVVSVPVFSNTFVPKPECDWKIGYAIQDFSLQHWIHDRMIASSTGMSSYWITKLLEDLDISSVINDQSCDRSVAPYFPLSNGWTSECPKNISLLSLYGSVSCTITNDCTGVHCCVNIDILSHSFDTYVLLDPCSYQLTVGIERLNFSILLFDYEWGKPQQFWLHGILRMDYSIYNLGTERKFLLNMNLSICLESKALCQQELVILKDTLLPKLTCDWNLDFTDPAFTLAQWYNKTGLEQNQKLTGYHFSRLMEDLSLTPYLRDTPCNRNLPPYSPNIHRWNSACLAKLNLPILPETLTCYITESCTGVDCCIDIERTGRPFNSYIHLDACNYKMMVGIEKLNFNITLFEYKWGKKEHVSLEGVIHTDFAIEDLRSERKYLLSLNLSVCFNAHGPCDISVIIFKNMRLPKPVCNYSSGYAIPDFSLKRWLSDRGITSGKSLDTLIVSQLLEETNLAQYMDSTSCSRSAGNCTLACPLHINLITLPGSISCHILPGCAGIDCCMDVGIIGRTFKASLQLDPCNYTLTFAIEKMKFTITLYEFEWGKTHDFFLFGIVRMRYNIIDLSGEQRFLVNMNLSVCFEAKEDCLFNVPVLQETYLPKLPCQWDVPYRIDNFSLDSWLEERGYRLGQDLSSDIISELMETLGIVEYLEDKSCNSRDDPYIPAMGGWSNACPSSINLPTLIGPVGCHVFDSCTAMECCVDIDILERQFHIYIIIDACNDRMTVGIERLNFNISLQEYKWGEPSRMCLFGVACMDFVLQDWVWERKYLISLNISVCMDSTGPCDVSMQILDQTRLSKPLCERKTDFHTRNFSLAYWTSERGLNSMTTLPDYVTSELLENLGVSTFFYGEQCNRHITPYAPMTDGFSTVTKCPLRLSLPSITGNATCFIPELCTSVDCCMEVPFLGRSMHAYITVDPCTYIMTVGIERLSFNVTLFNYEWGQRDHLHMMGVFKIDYIIFDLQSESAYLFSMELSVCLEASGPCLMKETIFNHTKLPKLPCAWNQSYSIPDFSLERWLKKEGLPAGNTISNIISSQLLEHIGLAAYVQEKSCRRSAPPYTPSSNGWNDACSLEISLPDLSSEVSCSIPSFCTGVDCCVDVDLIGRSFHTYVYLDTCSYILTIGMESIHFNKSLISYHWGQHEQVFILGVLRLEFEINNLQGGRKYTLNMNLSVCFESHGPCTVSVEVFRNTILPKTDCGWANGFDKKDFSLDSWLAYNTLERTYPLSDIAQSMLFEELGVASYLHKTPCNLSSFIPDKNGWKSDCPIIVDLPTLNDSMKCALGRDCVSFDCCVKSDVTNRTFHTYVDIDECGHRMTVGIEDLNYTTSLFMYKFGKRETIDLDGMIKMDFSVFHLETERKYLMQMSLSVCYDAIGPCEVNAVVFNDTKLPKQPCVTDPAFIDKNFSYLVWAKDRGLTHGTPPSKFHLAHLFEELGIAEYLSEIHCSRQNKMFLPSVNGWNNQCFMDMGLPVLPNTVSCYIPDTCTAVSCCMDSTLLGTSFNASVNIRPCDAVMLVQIEKMIFDISLLNYTWGKLEHYYLYGIVHVEFTVHSLTSSRKYILNMNMSICLEANGTCDQIVQVFQDTVLHEVPCSLDFGFIKSDFQLSVWKHNNGYSSDPVLSGVAISRLLEELGVSMYLEDVSCHRNFTPYHPRLESGWNKDCPLNITLHYLPAEAACYIPRTCSGVECCMDVNFMERSFHVYMLLDECNSVLTVGIEKLKFNISLQDFKWDKVNKFYLHGVIKLDYLLQDLPSQKLFIFNLNVSVCFDSVNCEKTVRIFQNTILPKIPSECDWNSSFAISDFSYKNWINSHGIKSRDVLNPALLSELRNDLAIVPFFADEACHHNSSGERWINDCGSDISLPALPDTITCQIPNICTGVQCCLSDGILQRPISASVLIDACNQQMTLAIEKFSVSVSLFNYEWGKPKIISVRGVYRITLILLSLHFENVFLIDMNISICLESSAPCATIFPVLVNTKLPKLPCPRKLGFAIQDFSLTQWLNEKGTDVNTSLSETVLRQLYKDLKLYKFFDDRPCDRFLFPYGPTPDGWNTTCPANLTTKSLNDSIACHIPAYCTGIDCCIQVDLLQRSFRTYVFLDACDFKLTVGIDKRKFEVVLFGYQWGTPEEFDLNGVIHAEFTVYRNLATKSYSFNLVLKVCFEAGGNCLKTISVMENTAIPMQECTYGTRFKEPEFTLSKWLISQGLSSTSRLSEVKLDKLINDLGLTSYLQQSCNRSATPFYPSSDGWNKDCSKGIKVYAALPDSLSCHVSDSCADLSCCVDVSILQRSLQAGFELDICAYMIYVRLEKMEIRTSLLTYKWGTEKTINIHNVIGIKYIINNEPSERKLKVDVWLKLCLDATCLVETPLLENAEYEYPLCNNTKSNITAERLPFPGLTMDFWKPEECSLLERKTECPGNQLPGILKSICAFTPDCQTVTCCLKLDFIPGSRHIQVNVRLDHCKSSLTYGIESKQWSKTWSGFSSNFNLSESVADSFGLRLEVTDMATMYRLNMSIKACGLATAAEDGSCQTYMLLVDTNIYKQACTISKTRRKRQASSGDSFIEGLKKLVSSGASDSEINTYVEEYQQKEAERRQQNLGRYDSTNPKEEMGYSSAVRALGDRNPATIEFMRASNAYFGVTTRGGDAISNMIGKGNDIVGRANQLFIVGQGLSGAGVKLLGNQLADMTIGDLESVLEMNRIDPLNVKQVGNNMKDLAKALYSTLIQKLFSGDLPNAFKSFDVSYSGSFPFPRQNIELFKVQISYFLGGFIFLSFEFGAGGYYGVDFTLTAYLMSMKGEAKVVPYGGLKVWGEVGIGFLLYGKLQIVGYIMDTRFPTTADIIFNKFPLNVQLTMDLELRPFILELNGLVTLEVNLIVITIKKTLYQHKIWGYSVPPIIKRLIDVGHPEQDKSPPEFGNILNSVSGKEKRSAGPVCEVQQLKHRDYTEPAFEIAVHAVDDKSQVKFFLDIGTVPGGNDVMKNQPLGGATTTLEQKLNPSGVPLYFTMYAENSAGARSSVACRLETYDVTLPGGRFSADFIRSSNPTTLKASVVVVDDSKLEKIQVGVGFGKGIYGDQMVTWTDINLVKRTSNVTTGNDPLNLHTLEHFTGMKNGKLMGPKFKVYEKITTAGDCARKCMDFPETKCLSFNFDYGSSGTCELLEAIEGLDFKLFQSGLFCHYERLGIGHAMEFSYEDLMLEHNGYYYFSLELINELGYKNFISTNGILVDFTPPEPGLIKNGSNDYLEIVPCLDNIPKDRPDWNMYCIGVSDSVKNHRVIIDGPGSRTVFNGDKPMQDIMYTRINNFVSANWDGIHDKETGLLGYSWTAGTKVCEELIHPHNDPHKHLLDRSQWTNSGQIYPLPDPYTTLPDGRYYITVRALSSVQYGGPLATTICHTTPYIVDTSPPFVYEIFNIKYNEETFLIYAEHNTSDPDSGIAQLDLCLGHSTRDCNLMEWQRYPYGPNITHTFEIPNGVPAWIKIRAINNVDLRTVGHADQAIIVDITPPEAGTVYDGPIYKTDLVFTKDKDQICANWLNFFDPESGIGKYAIGVGTNPVLTDIANLTLVEQYIHEICLALQDDKQLQHGHKYFTVVWAYNRAIKQRNVSAVSDGVIVDLTKPAVGEVADGNWTGFKDVQFSSSKYTVNLQWQGFHDPESHIRQYDVQILRLQHDSSEWEVLKNWATFENDTSSASWKNFHLYHKDKVKSTVRALNGALNLVERDTDGFIVDLTPPTLLYLGDGNNDKSDIEFQMNNSALSANFKFVDDESGLDHYKIQVFELKEGSRHQVYPEHDGSWVELKNTSMTSYTQTGLHLSAGAHYSLRVGAVNQAGSVATYDTNGVIVDPTPPIVHWIHVGVMAGEDEDVVDGFVYQSDHTGIKISWFALDHESGIECAMFAVGTDKGENIILDWTYLEGDLRDYYIENLNLQTTNEMEKSPVYYVSIKTKNGAEQFSTVVTSHPIIVLPEDVTGFVTDGPSFGIEYDIDYQSDMSTITVAFSGFESSQHGIMGFEWAIGTVAGGEDIQPYMDTGIAHTEMDDVAGNGVPSSGFAQTVVPLEHGSQYYTSIRAVTNAGNILEAITDGVMVDVTPPKITIDSLADVEFNGSESDQVLTLYQRSTDSLTARWHYNDTELLENGILDNIDDAWISVGTYPFGDDIWNVTDMAMSTNLDASLPVGLIHPESSGKPNLLSIWAKNSAGLIGKIVSTSVVVDQTPPINGQVNCPSFAKPHTPIKCNWTGFFDKESPITMYTVAMGTKEGLNDVVSPIEIRGHMDQYAFKVIDMKSEAKHGDIYYATVTATNKVGLQSYSFSACIRVDTTPPVTGQVIELYDEYRVNTMNDTATVLMNLRACKTSDECSAIDATCQESFTTVSVAWQPFQDPESGIVQYEIAVGTSPGGAQIKSFFDIPFGNNYIIHGLNLKGMKEVFVTVKGINGAGMSTVSTSNGIYLSYLSQGEKPPKLGGVWDDDPHSYGDIEYQTDRTTLYARWDVSGDPCPAVKYEWAIERLDGYRVQDFVDTFGTTHGVNDQLQMKNGERYYSLLRVTNALGYQYMIRSDGVTIREHQLVPGQVYDGDVFGYDLNIMKTKSKATANWEGFGVPRDAIKKVDILTGNAGVQVDDISPSKDQEVEYYEVALGTDRRFKKTRDDVVPFTKVGRNTSVTFWDLDLVPGFAMYYFTVRAYSASYSESEVTSNGFYVAFDGGVAAGKILMPDFVPTDKYLDVNWEGFTSKVDILMYYIALSNNSLANGTSCKRYIDGGHATEEEKNKLFSVFGVTNIGTNTLYRFSNILLEQGATYFAWVMGADKAGECNMTVHPVTIDVTPPTMGKVRPGPYYDMPVSYTMSNSSIHAYWQGFDDIESSIDHYEISLWHNSTCDRQTSTQSLLIPEIKLSSNYTDYAFVELNLIHSVPYIIKLTAVNKAGLSISMQTTPILHDASVPIPGHVGEGSDFMKDVVWWESDVEVNGTLLQLQNPIGPSCPSRHSSFKDKMTWKALNLYGFRDKSGIDWNIQYREANILINNLTDEMTIKLARDTKSEHMFSGGYFGSADMENGGDYEISIKAADGNGKAVTEILFWEGDMSLLDTFNFMEEPDWTADVCSCCFNTPVPFNCTCNCSSYLEAKAYYANLTYQLTGENQTTVTPTTTVATTTDTRSTVPWIKVDDKVKQQLKHNNTNINTPSHVTQRACGFQIYTGPEPYSIVWCQFYNDSSYPLSLKTWLPFNPAEEFHQYKISFSTVKEDVTPSWCLYVYVDGQKLSQLCGIPQFTTDTKLHLHVWNKDNFLPAVEDIFKTWTARASFRDLILPPKVGALCRYGEPFRSGTNAIVRYEAGIGTQNGLADFADFREILSPCLPCSDICSHYVCDPACDGNTNTLLLFTLKDLYLEPEINVDTENGTDIVPAIYYITVRAVLGSGATATASSNGFYVDLTPPIFDPNVMLYIDVRQGEFTPTHFQSSNDTIKSVWLCRDNQSDIEEYHWAIGTTPGGSELQSFISTGINPTGINSNLIGILEHNTTYYVSVKCRNQVGITTVWNDTKGVTVLLEPPDVEKVNASIEGAKQFDHPVEPKDAMTTSDPTTIGGSWEVSPDPSVTRYDYCVGSSRDVIDDIFPCTWVGLNVSGTVAIKGGNLTISGVPVRRLSELKPLGNDFNDTKYKTAAENIFHMEPGRTMFITMRLCNEATLCKNKFLGSVVVQTPNMNVATSTFGSPIDVKLDASRAKKYRRSVDVIDIRTPSGLNPGQSLITAVLENDDLTTQYRSDASMDFVPYIVNPNDTMDLVERKLARRLKEIYTVFTVVPVGHVSLPGPLLITFDNSNANVSGGDSVITLLHWNPDAWLWQISSGSCQGLNETETTDTITGKAGVKVCDTRLHNKNVTKARFQRDTSPTDHGMFSRETMFAISRVKTGIVNDAPVLNCTTHVVIKEDEGVLYDLKAYDPEGDKVIYKISPSQLPVSGEVMITPDGRFTYIPCKDCSGNITFSLILEDLPAAIDIPSARSTDLLTVEVEEENDPPLVFLYDADGQNMLNRDPTEPVIKFYEQLKVNDSLSFTAIFGAFDKDYGDQLTLHKDCSAHGNFSIDTLLANFTDKFKTCNKTIKHMCPDVNSAMDRSKMTWMAVKITYHLDSPYIGLDNLTFVVTDKSSTRSDIVTLQIALMKQPCHHNGGCKSKHSDRYECEDIRRTESFDLYYTCDCHGGWTGLRCEEDIDECVGNPCAEPMICLNLQNHFQCACPPDQPNCLPSPEDGFKWWMGALISVGCLLLIGIVVVCFCYKTGRLMAWKRGAYNVMAKIKNGSKVSIMSDASDDSINKSEDRVENKDENKKENIDVEEENSHISVLEVSRVDINADTPKLDFGFAPGVLLPPHHRMKTKTTHT